MAPAACGAAPPPPPPPLESHVTAWEKDPLAGCGAYATACSSSSSSSSDVETEVALLCRPLPCGAGLAGEAALRHDRGALTALLAAQGGVFFCGEALHAEHMGSVHGAMLSGRRAAAEVAGACAAAAASAAGRA